MKVPGEKIINGNRYNRYGVCLDCNGNNPDCTHNNLTEHQGNIICVLCGFLVEEKKWYN